MRGILFKAKRANWKELPKEQWWVYRYFVKGRWYRGENEKERYGILPLDSCLSPRCEIVEWIEIDPETLCQWTGLTDKNGKKIWENDIVETVYDGNLNPNYIIVWDKDELDFKATNGKEHYGTNYEYLGCCDEIVVIGNVFDNADLLENL